MGDVLLSLSVALIVEIKLALFGPIIVLRKGLTLLMMILVVIL